MHAHTRIQIYRESQPDGPFVLFPNVCMYSLFYRGVVQKIARRKQAPPAWQASKISKSRVRVGKL